MTDMEILNLPIGDRLRQVRASRGLTQEELAELVHGGISVDTISNIERGRVRPRRHTLLALLDALGVASDDRHDWLSMWRSQSSASDAVGEAGRSYFPNPVTPLIGREEVLASLRSLLLGEDCRVVTLTGPGGVGKTRLAIAGALAVRDHFSDGCAFADLTSLQDPDQLLGLVAFSLGLGDFGDRPIQERIIAFLRDKDQLLVLDNAESAASSSALLTPVLEACTSLKLLVTSREPLHLLAEHEFTVPPLALPPIDTEYAVSEVARVPSVDFLLQRVRMVTPGFSLSRENVQAVAGICRRLDGLPLALELAAARFRHYSPEVLAGRLDQALNVLVDGPRDLPERQRTLRATIEWSYAQLTDTEQRTLRRLSVFVNGFSEAAAAMVCAEGAGSAETSVDVALDGLLYKSLLILDPAQASDGRRFRMLETIREYAWERLREAGEDAAVQARHARFFAGLAEAAFPELYSARRATWMETLRTEYANLLAALTWSLEADGDTETGLRLAGSLGRFWYYTANLNDGRQWLRKALVAGMKGEPSHSLARVFYSAGKLAWVQGDFSHAVSHSDRSVDVASIASPELFLAECLTLLAYTLVSAGNYKDALPAFERSLEIERRLGAEWQTAFSLAMYSEALRLDGKTDEASSALSESLSICQALGDPWITGVNFAMTAGLHHDFGDDVGMDDLLDLAEASFRDMSTETYALARLSIVRGYVNLRLGRLEAAAERFRVALKSALELGQTAYILVALAGVASLAAARGDLSREAAMLYSHAASLLDSDATYVDDGAVMARVAYAHSLPLIQEQLSQDALQAAVEEGRNLPMELAVELAYSVLSRSFKQT